MTNLKHSVGILLVFLVNCIFSLEVFSVEEETEDIVTLFFSSSEYSLQSYKEGSEYLQVVYTEAVDHNFEDVGKPLLPKFNTIVCIPSGTSVIATLSTYNEVIFSEVSLPTVQPLLSATEEVPTNEAGKYGYADDIFVDYQLDVSEPFQLYGYTFVSLAFCPFAYDASTSTLSALENATISLTVNEREFEKVQAGDTVSRPSKVTVDILEGMILNPPGFHPLGVEERHKYLLVTSPRCNEWATEYAKYRILTGYDVYYREVTQNFDDGLSDNNPYTQEVMDIVDGYDPEYVFIAGDYGSTPAYPDVAAANYPICESKGNPGGTWANLVNVWTDQLYAGMPIPWRMVGRLPYYDFNEDFLVDHTYSLEYYLERVRAYETRTRTNHSYDTAVLIGGYDKSDEETDHAGVCEVARGVLLNHGDRVCTSSVVYGNNGSGVDDFMEQLDGGVGLVAFLGHGSLKTWGFSTNQKISYNDIENIQNQQTLPISFEFSCKTGNFIERYDIAISAAVIAAKCNNLDYSLTDKGIISSYAATSKSPITYNGYMLVDLARAYTNRHGLTLGGLIASMKAEYRKDYGYRDYFDKIMLNAYNTLGDPALMLPIGRGRNANLGITTTEVPIGETTTIEVTASICGEPLGEGLAGHHLTAVKFGDGLVGDRVATEVYETYDFGEEFATDPVETITFTVTPTSTGILQVCLAGPNTFVAIEDIIVYDPASHISEDTTWNSAVHLDGDLWIDAGITLTLAAGADVSIAANSDSNSGLGGQDDERVEIILGSNAHLVVDSASPVSIHSDAAGELDSGWAGIRLGSNATVEGRSLLLSDAEHGIILSDGSSIDLTDSTVSGCSTGVLVRGENVEIDGLVVERCITGIEVAGGGLSLRDSNVSSNQLGIRVAGDVDAGSTGGHGQNIISGNGEQIVFTDEDVSASFVGNAWGTFYASRVDEIFDDVNVDGLEYFPFQVAGVLGEDETVPPPPIMGGSIALDGDLIVPAGLTLTIPAGCTLEATNTDIAHSGSDSQKAELIVGSGGSLLSEGTVQNPILLTNSNDIPDSWYGVRFTEGSSGSLQHTVIEKAIYGVESSASPQLDNVELRECSLAGYRSLGGSGELTDCFIHDNDNPASVIEGDDYGHGVIATMGSEVSLRNCEITDNAGDGVRVLGGSPDLGSYESLGRNQFDDNEGLDISYESGVAPGGSLAARGNEFGTIDGIELDLRVSDSVDLSPVVFGGTVDHGSDLPYIEPGEELLPVCYVDRDVYLVDDFTAEPAVISIDPDNEDLVYFELRFAPNIKVGMAPQQETETITPTDPALVDVLIDIPCFFEEPEEGVSSVAVEPSGGFIPSPWEINESQLPVEFNWGEFVFGEHCYELDWHEALIDDATSVKMDSGQFDETNPALFERVFIRNIDGNGFELFDGAASFRRCQLTDNLGNGLQLNSGTWAKLYRCEISGNGGDGIYLANGAEIDLGVPVGGDEPMIGLNYFANNAGFDLNNKSGSTVAAHGNQWSESDWELILANSINSPGGMDYSYLFPVAWSGVLKSGNTLGECKWMGNMLLLGDVTVPVGMLAGQSFQLNFETPSGAEGIEIAELPGLDRTRGGIDPDESEFRINGEVISEDPIHLTRLSLPTVMDGEFPPPEIGEWTGLIVSSPDQLTLNEYNVRWAEIGIQVIGGGLTTLSNCEVTDSNTAVVLEGVSSTLTLFGNELHAEVEGLVCTDNSWPVLLDEPNSNSFYLDFNLTTLPSHFYIANRNSSVTPDDPTTIDATLCKWYDAAGDNQEPEDWMFDGEVDYDSQAMLTDNSSQIISEDDKTELNDHKNTIDLASDEDTSAIEIDSSNDSIIGGIEEESARLNTDESATLNADTLEATALEAKAFDIIDSIEKPTQLLSVVPNPTTGMITITVELSNSQRVELSLYDLAGRLVETIHRGSLSEGRHSLSYDTSGISGGLYLLHLATDEATETIRLAIVR